jgi:hypothetical protein
MRRSRTSALSYTLVISSGCAAGIDVGVEYFVRRLVLPGRSMGRLETILHTAGWVRIIATNGEESVAQVVGVCDGLHPGDFLEPPRVARSVRSP